MIIKSHMIPKLDILGNVGKFVIRGTTHQLFRPVT